MSSDNTVTRIGEINIPHMWKVRFMEEVGEFLISIHDVCSKLIVVDKEFEQFVCAMPNVFEID